MESEAQGAEAGGIDRRKALIGLGVGATAAWAAPTIISQSAVAAATVTPDCAMCGEEPLVNGGAESGLLTPWVASGTNPFVVDTWANITADGISPQPGSGSFAFTGSNTTGSTADGQMDQTFAIGPSCDSAVFTFSSSVGGVAPTAFVDVSVVIEFFDSGAASLGDGGAAGHFRQISQATTDAMQTVVSFGSVPVGAVSATVTASWGGEGESPYVARVAVDQVLVQFADAPCN